MQIEATHLGKKSSYPQHYDPSVLVAIPRLLNRELYGLVNNALPFSGYDVWHAWEFSFLLDKGWPVTGILKIVYPCNNEFLVESKSLKLYLNSFNMDCFGENINAGIARTTAIIKADLQQLLNCTVDIHFFNHADSSNHTAFDGYTLLEEMIDPASVTCSVYNENPELLEIDDERGELKWGTHLMRSNCKITFQPDWGSLFIAMKGERLPVPESFLKYLVSLRNENHFHEEICEMVFKRMIDKYQPDSLMVACLYTRRGGIDINPVRSLNEIDLPENLINVKCRTLPAFRQ